MGSIAVPRPQTQVIVLGAGFHGLAAAKTYLQLRPDIDITIVDCESAIGGVWSEARIYPGLLYEVPAPMAEFSDLDMCEELGIEKWSDITGYQMNRYILKYAKKFGLVKRCRLNTQATNITRSGQRWVVQVHPAGYSTSEPEFLTCDKLIVATGMCSKPRFPDLDMSAYSGLSMHAKSIGERYQELLAEDITTVTVVGGHKSALEVVGLCAQAGKSVNWLVKKEGGGTTWMIPARDAKGSNPAMNSTKRLISLFAPSVYGSHGWINRFLYSGRFWLGTWIIDKFWTGFSKMLKGDRYEKSENAKKLEPALDSMFWFLPGGTTVHDRDIETFRLVSEEKLIRVERDHIVSAKGHSLMLSSGQSLQSDAMVFCTGWELGTSNLFNPALSHELGIPSSCSTLPIETENHWMAIDMKAEQQVLDLYPILAKPPNQFSHARGSLTPFRLFRSIVPPNLAARDDNSLIFLGSTITGRVQTNAELSSLWGVAYLESLLPNPISRTLQTKEEMHKDIAHIEAFRKKRYLGWYPLRISVFETAEFFDQLMSDMGMRADRKAMKREGQWLGGWKGWWAEWTEGYFAKDYSGIVEEFKESVGNREEEREPL